MGHIARPLAVVVLAAGQGKRMRSARPKVLHEIAGAPMLAHVLRTAAALGPARMAVVVGHGAEAVGTAAEAVAPGIAVCLQAERRGTGHAARMAAPALEGFEGDLLVLYGDTPLIGAETLARLRAAEGAVRVLGFEAADPGRYGRLVLGADGTLQQIVEAKDASADELAITLCNSGVMAGDAATMLRLLGDLRDDNAQGEFYLTDLVGLARAEGLTAAAVLCDEAETLGVNDRVQLAAAEAAFQARARRDAMLAGATLTAPETVFLAWDTELAEDVTVGPHVVFGPGVRVAEGAEIRAFCHLERAAVGPGAIVGPYARLRPGAEIGAGAHIGNFVEIKNAVIEPGAKANHLSYVGDAHVGAGSNLGAGTITCNYDGYRQTPHRDRAGRVHRREHCPRWRRFRSARTAYVATGTVLTRDVPEDALAIARVPNRSTNRAPPGTCASKLKARKAAKTAKSEG